LDTVEGGLNGGYYAVVDRYRLRWMDVAYEPGELRVVAYKKGAVLGEVAIKTASDPAKLALIPDCTEIAADGTDLSYVLVKAVDGAGNSCPLADDLIVFTVDGPAEIAGIGNGNPLSMEPFQLPQHSLFHGKAMLILRSLDGEPGSVRVTAKADGYESAQIHIHTRPMNTK
jgi:beta-galactosidase